MAVSLVACETVETPNGVVPEKYIDMVQSMTGLYAGSFYLKKVKSRDGHSETISQEVISKNVEVELSLNGNKPTLYSNVDWTSDTACGSQIIQLDAFRIFSKERALAFFRFDPGACALNFKGRSLDLWIERDAVGNLELRSEVVISTKTVDLGRFKDRYTTLIVGKFSGFK